MQRKFTPLFLLAAALLCGGLLLSGGCSGGSDIKITEGSGGTGGSGGSGGSGTSTYDLLWSAGKLYQEMASDPNLLVLDCRKDVADAAGVIYTPYDVEHIEGAHYIDFFLFGDPYPDDLGKIIAGLSDLGITADTRICLYDEAIANPQGKVFFHLERLGCTDVHILDGGLPVWKGAGGAVTDAVPPPRTPSTFVPDIDNTSYAKLEDMKVIFDMVHSGSTSKYTLTDFREPPLYYGHKICPDAVRHGHMPDCALLNWQDYFDSTTGLWKSPSALESLCLKAGMHPDKVNVVICNKGWRTGIAYFTLRYIGWPRDNILHYVGGIREWTFEDPAEYLMVSEACYENCQPIPPGNSSAKRFSGAFAQIGSKVYCMGGYHMNTATKVAEISDRNQVYDIATDTWDEGADALSVLPEKLGFPAGAAVGDTVYVMGGLKENGEISPKVYAYDTVNNIWDDGNGETPLPVARFSFPAAVIGSKIYICGGLTGTTTSITANYSAKVYAYNTNTKVWDFSLPDLPQGRRCHTIVALGDTLYVLGGFYYDDSKGAGVDMRDILALDTQNPGSGWVHKADMPMDLAGHFAAVANDGTTDKIYVLSGWSLDGIRYDVIEYDPAKNAARILKVNGRSASIGWPRYWYFIGAHGSKIASIGGFGGSPSSIATCMNSGFTHFHQTYVYDVSNDFDP